MKERRPVQGAARGTDLLKRGSGEHNLVAQLSRRNPIAFTPWSVWCDLDNQTQTDLRHMWWRLRRRGVRLPAERGVIVIDGGR